MIWSETASVSWFQQSFPKMALHRDIFWVGRQWAVTGSGMQAVDQKLGGQFDIEIARLWDEGWLDLLRGQSWINADDFAKGLAIARTRFPEPPPDASPPLPIEALLQVIAAPSTPPRPRPAPEAVAQKAIEPETPPALPEAEPLFEPAVPAAVQPESIVLDTIEPAKPESEFLQMRIAEHSGQLVRVWRVQRRQ